MKYALLFCLAEFLCGCEDHKPKCQDDPPFYLKGTDYDCAVRQQ